jgi:hypothetical protein
MEDITTTVEDTNKTMGIVAACALVGFAAYGVGTLISKGGRVYKTRVAKRAIKQYRKQMDIPNILN